MEPKSIANATFNQVANATVAPATVLLMNEQNIQAWRVQRLAAMVEREGGKAAAGRKLGYRDGAFVGQMLRGERPITEKTVFTVHSLSGYAGWFDSPKAGEGAALPPAHEPSNVANTEPGPPLRGKVPLEQALQAVACALESLSPILQPAGQSTLEKWVHGQASLTETATTLAALAQASQSLPSAPAVTETPVLKPQNT